MFVRLFDNPVLDALAKALLGFAVLAWVLYVFTWPGGPPRPKGA